MGDTKVRRLIIFRDIEWQFQGFTSNVPIGQGLIEK